MTQVKKYVKSKKAYKVKFSLPGTIEGTDIRVLGEFNNWDWDKAPSMKKTKSGYKVEIMLEPGKMYEYRYCIDNETWFNDSNADSYSHVSCFSIENCVIDLPHVEEATQGKKTSGKKVSAKKAPATKKVDLTVIEGVGPKISGLLKDAGYETFKAVAKAKPAALKEVLLAAGRRYTMHDPTTWPVQAKLVADGKMDKLKKLQAELKGGKKA